MGLNLGRTKVCFFFAKISFWLEYERAEETLANQGKQIGSKEELKNIQV